MWSDNADLCSRLATAEALLAAVLLPGQMGAPEQVGSRSPAGCKAGFWPQIVFLWEGRRTGRPHRL